MAWYDLLLIAVAVNAILHYWLRGKLFEDVQAQLENSPFRPWLGERVDWYLTALLRCGLCLAPYLALLLITLWLPGPLTWVGAATRVLVNVLVVARAANLIHDLWSLLNDKNV